MCLIVACGQRVTDHFLPRYLTSTLLTDFFSFFLLLSCSLSLLLIRLIVVFSSIIACFVWPFCIFRPSLRVLCFLSCSLLKNLIKCKLLNSTWPNCIVFDFEKTLLAAEKRKENAASSGKTKKTLLAAEKNYFPNALSTQTRVEMSSTGPNYARKFLFRASGRETEKKVNNMMSGSRRSHICTASLVGHDGPVHSIRFTGKQRKRMWIIHHIYRRTSHKRSHDASSSTHMN